MSISLTPEQQAFIESRVQAGFYESPQAMIDMALDELERAQDRKARERSFFDREIKPALEELYRGDGAVLDMKEIIAEANRRLDAKGLLKIDQVFDLLTT